MNGLGPGSSYLEPPQLIHPEIPQHRTFHPQAAMMISIHISYVCNRGKTTKSHWSGSNTQEGERTAWGREMRKKARKGNLGK